MLTFLGILKELPQIEEKREGIARYLGLFVIANLVLLTALAGAAIYWNKAVFIYAASIPASMALFGVVLDTVYEARSIAPTAGGPGAWLAEGLDQRFAQEKRLAAELAKSDLADLKRMSTRLDAELIRGERWLDVLKPFGMLLPAVVVLATLNIFHLPGLLQDFAKILAVAATIGVMIGAISIYKAMLRLRAVASTLHHAIDIAEAAGKPVFRKVSRKRGQDSVLPHAR